MNPYYQAEAVELYLGDCIEVMRTLPEASVDAVVCDPPYGLEFMGKAWDRHESPRAFQSWCEAWAREAYRVLKPGGHLAAFGGTRTYHRLASGIQDAGFDIRDTLAWIYGSGFPKSLDVSKAIDKAAGAERDVIGVKSVTSVFDDHDGSMMSVETSGGTNRAGTVDVTAPATAEAAQWAGWGTALKPAYEPITLARKPLIGTVAANVLAHGTGAINIDGTRIGTNETWGGNEENAHEEYSGQVFGAFGRQYANPSHALGRWPANVLLDEAAAALLDATVGDLAAYAGGTLRSGDLGQINDDGWEPTPQIKQGFGDTGGPSRFFYTAKASRSEREAGLDDLPPALRTDGRDAEGPGADNPRLRVSERHNDHPTVKPIAVMRWLCRLVTPPGGVILDPFLGSGTTALAALDDRFRFIGIDIGERYVEIARWRLSHRHLLDVETKPATASVPQGRLI